MKKVFLFILMLAMVFSTLAIPTVASTETSGDTGTVQKGIYDLQGRKIENPTKGIYIIDGEKVILK